MSNASFDIDFAELCRVQNSYSGYYSSLSEGGGGALCMLDGAFSRIASLDSMKGASANAIKAYFSEVHGSLIEQIDGLASQLLTDLCSEFYPQFREGEISETHDDARWPKNSMTDAADKMTDIVNGDLAKAQESIRAALKMMPGDIAISEPSATQVVDDLLYEHDKTKKVKDAVESADKHGAQIFKSKDCEFTALASAIGKTLKKCRKQGGSNMGTYESGAFTTIALSTGLASAYTASRESQEKHAETVIASRKDSIVLERASIERAEKAALKQKQIATTVGTVASVLVLAAGCVAAVATAGAATPVLFALNATVSLYGVGKSAVDVYNRTDQMLNAWTGDKLKDKEEYENEQADIAVGAGKFVKKALKIEHHANENSFTGLREDGADLINWGGNFVLDETVDAFKEQAGLTEEQSAYVDGGWEILKESKDQLIGGEFKGYGYWAAAGTAFECASDYYANEADRKLEQLSRRTVLLSETEKAIGQAHVWNSDEGSIIREMEIKAGSPLGHLPGAYGGGSR